MRVDPFRHRPQRRGDCNTLPQICAENSHSSCRGRLANGSRNFASRPPTPCALLFNAAHPNRCHLQLKSRTSIHSMR